MVFKLQTGTHNLHTHTRKDKDTAAAGAVFVTGWT